MELLEAAEKLHDFMISFPQNVIDIPDEIWLPFIAALEQQKSVAPAPNNTNEAIALLYEAVQEFKFGNLGRWFGENGKRINDCLAQQHHS